MPEITFTAPPTCARFMKSNAFGRIVAGPVGSGKTTACIYELLRRSLEQEPAPDGFRYTRWAIVRQTLKQLKDTVLKDIIRELGPLVNYRVSDSAVKVEFADVRSEWLLIPLDSPEDTRRLLSSQLTGAWMSECIEMNIDIIPALSGRVGRYPAAKDGGASWFGIIADTNMPTEGSDWHEFMALNTPPDWQIFIQPSGLSPDAENLDWLVQTPETLKLPVGHPDRRAQGRTYYERLVRSYGEDSDWVKRYVKAEYGPDPSGTAVFRGSFKPDWHVTDELEPVPGHPLIVAQDFGRDPCSLICQYDHKGRLLILEEVIAEDIGLQLHIDRSLRPALMQPRYLGRPIAVVGDPAGKARSTIYEETSFDVMKRLGFSAFPAPTNDLDPRLRAVEAFLLGSRDGGPAILFDRKRCPKLILAMGGGYRYAKTKDGKRRPQPDKNEYSHIADCLQYAALVAHGGMTSIITNRIRPTPRREPRHVSPAAWT